MRSALRHLATGLAGAVAVYVVVYFFGYGTCRHVMGSGECVRKGYPSHHLLYEFPVTWTSLCVKRGDLGEDAVVPMSELP